jgi:LmbE family N-acetylglucosaminyl deacetylase
MQKQPPDGRGGALFIVSPHLDDAIFGCGMLLATHPASTVCTVFAGQPTPPMQTDWDRAAGFRDSDEALAARLREDDRALAIVGAHAVRLTFLDSQYVAAAPALAPTREAVAAALVRAWRAAPRTPDGTAPILVVPIGLYHSDHLLTASACRLLLREGIVPHAVAYADALYRRIPGTLAAARDALLTEGLALTPFEDMLAHRIGPTFDARAAGVKWRAVRAYRTQLSALGDAHPNDLVEPERYWQLALQPRLTAGRPLARRVRPGRPLRPRTHRGAS